MGNPRSLLWRQVIAGSLIALGLALALANIGTAQMAKADTSPPVGWREQRACALADDILNHTWQRPKITAVR